MKEETNEKEGFIFHSNDISGNGRKYADHLSGGKCEGNPGADREFVQ